MRGIRAAKIALMLAMTLVFAGCVGLSVVPFKSLLLALAMALFVASCVKIVTQPPDGEKVQQDGQITTDASSPDRKGTWSPCCAEGKIKSCFCPAGAACNYAPYQDCGDGRCVTSINGNASCDEAPETPDKRIDPPTPDRRIDPPRPDLGNEPSSPDKRVDPPAPDKRVEPPKPDGRSEPPAPDRATPPERQGTWQPCCKDGKIDKCFCPQGVACNYGWFTRCDDGSCVPSPNRPQDCP